MIEARKHALGEVHPEVGTDVALVIDRIGEGVHAFPVGHVWQECRHGHFVKFARSEAFQREARTVVHRGLDRFTVNSDSNLAPAGKIKERGAGSGPEPHRRDAVESRRIGEVEFRAVRDLVEVSRAGTGFGQGERHASDTSGRMRGSSCGPSSG